MQKQTEGWLSHISAWEQTRGHAILRVNNVVALHGDFPSSFFIASLKLGVIVLPFCVCIPLLLGKYKYLPLCTKTSAGPSTTLPVSSPHPSISSAPVLHRAPQALLITPSQLFDIMLLWLSGPLCWLLSEADWRPIVCVSPCPAWLGRNLLGCEQRDRNAHMNGLVCAGHLLTEKRRASMSLSSSA